MKPTTENNKMKKENIDKVNPFNYHYIKEKLPILGKKLRHSKTRPGQSREKAIEIRKNTLLKEYKNRHRSRNSYFKDRRLGQNNPALDDEKKSMLRRVAVNKREAKRAMYNLHDEVLTHKGVPLNDENMQDTADFSDEEGTDDENGQIDGEYVESQHFGGGLFSRNQKETPTENKSRKEWIDEIISESKKKKLAAKEDKTMHEEAVADINEASAAFMKTDSAKTMTKDYKDEAKKGCDFKSYDKFYLNLTQDESGRANPTDRLKTSEELGKEQEQKIKTFEKERLHRMKNAYEQDQDKYKSRFSGKSADALDASFKLINPVEDEEDSSNKEQNNINKPSNKTIKKKYENIDVVEESEIKKDEKEPVSHDENEKTNLKVMNKTKKKFPKTFEVPDEFKDFFDFLKDYSPLDVSVIVGKFIENNHPTTGKPHLKCCQIFAFLLQVLERLCQPEGESLSDKEPALSYCEAVIGGLFQLIHLSPATSANIFNEMLKDKFRNFSLTKFQQYPFTDTFILLRVASILYPVSDFQHDVLTPAHVFLSTLLGYAKVACKRDIIAMFFTVNLLFEYNKPAKRFMVELIWALKGLLYMAVPQSEKKLALSVHKCISKCGHNSELLTLSKAKKRFDSTNCLKFSAINDKHNILTNKFRLVIIAETLKLLAKVVETYSNLSIAKIIFQSIKKFLDLLPINQYPQNIRELHQNVISAIIKLPGPGHQLVLNRPRPQTITFYEPRIEEVRDSKWKQNNPNAEVQRQKLSHKRERKATKREIKKDFQYLAGVRLQETIAHDAERKRKYNTIMRELGTQEGEFQRYKKLKKQ